jgi:uncharacterized membrane protein YjjP (DUF1212 family)
LFPCQPARRAKRPQCGLLNPSAMPPAALDEVANLSLSVGKLFLETGCKRADGARSRGRNLERLRLSEGRDLLPACAIIVMFRRGAESCVQMGKVGEHGVNLRRAEALSRIVSPIALGKIDCPHAQREVDNVPRTAPGYPGLVCLFGNGNCVRGVWTSTACGLALVCSNAGRYGRRPEAPALPARAETERFSCDRYRKLCFRVPCRTRRTAAWKRASGDRDNGCRAVARARRGRVKCATRCHRWQVEPRRRAQPAHRLSFTFHDSRPCRRATLGCPGPLMSVFAPHLLHQAFFGGVAAAGFAVLFNCPPRLLWIAFGAGALALAVRTGGQEIGGLSLPAASFSAAFVLALLNRILEPPDSPRGSVLAVVGCNPDESRQPGGL